MAESPDVSIGTSGQRDGTAREREWFAPNYFSHFNLQSIISAADKKRKLFIDFIVHAELVADVGEEGVLGFELA